MGQGSGWTGNEFQPGTDDLRRQRRRRRRRLGEGGLSRRF